MHRGDSDQAPGEQLFELHHAASRLNRQERIRPLDARVQYASNDWTGRPFAFAVNWSIMIDG